MQQKHYLRKISMMCIMVAVVGSAFAQSTVDVLASIADGFVSDPALVTANNPYVLGDLKIGSSDVGGNPNLTSAIIPFELPTIPDGKEITAVSLTVHVSYGRQWANSDVDLYGLGYSSTATISSSDHFAGDFGTGNGSDTGIQDDFISKNVDLGNLDTERDETTDATGGTNLLAFIKAQYDAGAAAGDFVFLRLSIDNVSMTGSQYFNVDDGAGDSPAKLVFTFDDSDANKAPVLAAVGDQEVQQGESPTVVLSGSDLDGENSALVFSANNLPSFASITNNDDGTADLAISPLEEHVGVYPNVEIIVSDGEDTDTEIITITVTNGVTVDITSTADGYVSDATLVTENNPYYAGFMKLGKSDVGGNANLTTAIIPFELPAIPEGKEIRKANLKVYVSYGREWVTTNVDLYGLEYNAAADISSLDHFVGAYGDGTGNGSDFGIEDDYFTKNVANGSLDTERYEETSASGDANLASYLKAQYDAGAVAGDYVFLRLSVDNTAVAGAHYFKVEGDGSATPPTLSITFDEPVPAGNPTLAPIGNQTVTQYGYLKIDIEATVQNSDPITLSTSDNLPSEATFTDYGDGTGSIEIISAGVPQAYADIVITASNGSLSSSETISITYEAIDPSQQMNLDEVASDRFAVTDLVWPASHGEAAVSFWHEDKVAATTITIDDNIEADHSFWLGLQETYDQLKFTWFIIDNQVTDWNKYQALLDAGNEVNGHDDCDINSDVDENDTSNDKVYRTALESIQNDIATNLSAPATTYAYPCGIEFDTDIARDIYIAMRGTFGVMNQANRTNYLALDSRSATNSNEDIDNLLDETRTVKLFGNSYYRGWYATHYHSVTSNEVLKTNTENHMSYINDHADELWIAGFSEAAKYGQERDSHTLTIDQVEASEIKFTLTDDMKDEWFDFPLTVKVRVANDWGAASATQNGVPVEATLVTHESDKYVLVKAVPDNGQVTLTGTGEATPHAPVLDPIGAQGAVEGESKSIDLSATDADGDGIMFSLSGAPAFITLTDNGDGTADLVVNAQSGDAGTYTLTVKVSDGTLTDEEEITVTVTAAVVDNTAPELAAIGDQTLEAGQALEVALSATDAESDALSYSIKDEPAFVSLTDNGDGTGKIRISPTATDAGTYTFTIAVSDGTLVAEETITLIVTEPDAEVLVIGDEQWDAVTVYPNPSVDGRFYLTVPAGIQVSQASISIYSAFGQEMIKRSITLEHNGDKIDVLGSQSLPTGYYLMMFSAGEVTKKMTLLVK
ncbi:Ig-like domain-containing protein [Reichenbachiella carrageenanivorans]|uniref:Ig-like domain-containing protein n=1 Tax=Reichenbachiella carrageenanivorans TaxID=2979869 RepID=A0ABY6D162_9BACT|nr:Ig-like domain-containing protein [Reichenbachiella carrageenanivorans]UXX79907.1 Ig-like domain-containing protein [Reichenbachiella carrageenanivorans]